MDEKLRLVEAHRERHGLNRCLRALGVSKGTWHYLMRGGSKAAERAARDQALRAPTLEILRKHLDYGYRRIQPDLEEVTGEPVNHERLRPLMNPWDLALHRTVSRPKPSTVRCLLSKARGRLNLLGGREPGPLDVLSTDFTDLRYAGGHRKAWLIGFVDVGSAWMPDWAVGPSANRSLALRGWKQVRRAFRRLGANLAGTLVHQAQDAVFISYAWLRALLLKSRVRVSYSENGARDNPWIESFWARSKQENHSLFIEAETLEVRLRSIYAPTATVAHLRQLRRHLRSEGPKLQACVPDLAV